MNEKRHDVTVGSSSRVARQLRFRDMHFPAAVPVGGGGDDVLCGLLLAGGLGVQVTVRSWLDLDCPREGRCLLFLQFRLTF